MVKHLPFKNWLWDLRSNDLTFCCFPININIFCFLVPDFVRPFPSRQFPILSVDPYHETIHNDQIHLNLMRIQEPELVWHCDLNSNQPRGSWKFPAFLEKEIPNHYRSWMVFGSHWALVYYLKTTTKTPQQHTSINGHLKLNTNFPKTMVSFRNFDFKNAVRKVHHMSSKQPHCRV